MTYANSEKDMALREENRKKVMEFFAHGAHAPMELFHPDAIMVQPFFFPDQPRGPDFAGGGGNAAHARR